MFCDWFAQTETKMEPCLFLFPYKIYSLVLLSFSSLLKQSYKQFILLLSEFNFPRVKEILTATEKKIRRRSTEPRHAMTPIFQVSNPSCESPFFVTRKLSIVNGADPVSLASAIGDRTSSTVGIGSLELYNISISATTLPGENEINTMPRKPRLFRYSGIKNSRSVLLKFLEAWLCLFSRSGSNGPANTILTTNVTVSLIGIVAWFSVEINTVITVPDSGGISVKSKKKLYYC